jgi:hypothetical protein
MNEGRRVLRVFLSSTATDMAGCRDKVRDAILQLGHLPVGMETFTAKPGIPAAECEKLAADADVVVAMLAHRYGYVPPPELGGDGERSITWLEVAAAREASKPVLAFVIDLQAKWELPKDSDLLNTEPEENHEAVLAAIRGLKRFREHLAATSTLQTFSNEDDLARKVTTAFVAHVGGINPVQSSLGRVWKPRVCYPLQPAPQFEGRDRLRHELVEWTRAPVTPDRVVSLVAAGGTGKTALAERVVATVDDSRPAGLLVWSFYENPRTEELLRTACRYFTDKESVPLGGSVEGLQVALTGDEAHLLVLDGLERVQAEGTTGRPRGELEDPQLRRLLRWLAAGRGTRARALVTSRFPLVDLADWKGAGHREEKLDNLEPSAAGAVLARLGVRGDVAVREKLARDVGCHALTVAVLGSYLARYHDGNPAQAPTFHPDELAAVDVKSARLNRVLQSYAEKLLPEERDLLARLSVFPRGVTIELLAVLIGAGGTVAGTLVGCAQPRLLGLLERLREMGLVFRYQTDRSYTFNAHPFLRAFFQARLGATRSEDVHEAVRLNLAPSLEARPRSKPTAPLMLDRYEALIEHTRLAGRISEAFELYWFGLASSHHLINGLCEYGRALRILSGFSSDGTPASLSAQLSDQDRLLALTEWDLAAAFSGDLATARSAGRLVQALVDGGSEINHRVLTTSNLSALESYCGNLVAAAQLARAALRAARDRVDVPRNFKASATGALGYALWQMGELPEARRCIDSIPDDLNESYAQEVRIRIEIARCDLGTAEKIALTTTLDSRRSRFTSFFEALLGRIVVSRDPIAATQHLQSVRGRAARSGDVDIQLCCYQLATEIALALTDLRTAEAEAESGIHLADSTGFGLHAIDLRLARARVHLDAAESHAALRRAREALDRAVHPECCYAWGEADALHLAGLAHARLGETELAQQRLKTALQKREKLTHPRTEETRTALARLEPIPAKN